MWHKLLFFLLAAGCGWAFAAPPNIILITLDTTRADRMGFLGSKRGLTPNLDALAKQSVVFTHAYAQVPLTTPSHAAMLTGTYPQFNHIRDLGAPLRMDVPYLPELLHEHGYHTAAFVGASILDPAATAPGFDWGFDEYDANFHRSKPGEDRYHSIERRAEDVADRGLGWLSRHRETPFFIWLHFYDAHDPYDPPEPFKTHYASAPYDGEIAYTDSVVGSLLEVLRKHGLYETTTILVAADHGEAFGEHGEERHGVFLYDETIHVPLVIKLPAERSSGRRVEERVPLASVAPSLLEVAGIAPPAAMQARSLIPLIEAAPNKPTDNPVYSETNYSHRTFGWAELHSWRSEKYLYVQAPKRELYDETSDPEASKNIAPTAPAVADTLSSQLDDFEQRTAGSGSEPTKLDPSQAEKLRSLGYLASDSPSSSGGDKAAVDPKDKIALANLFHSALIDQEEDRYESAVMELRSMLKQDPDIASVYLEMGRDLVHLEKYSEAVPVLRTAAEKNPSSGMAHYEFGVALSKTGEWDAALREMQAAVVCDPGSAQLHYEAAVAYIHLKRVAEASAEYEKTLEIDPNHFLANLTYGRVLLVEGHPEEALPRLSRAVTVDPGSAEAHGFLAAAYQKLGKTQDAERERAKALELKAKEAD